jgi:hypothetical protein
MFNTDMIIWSAGTATSVGDYWSTGHATPVTDDVNNLNTTTVLNANNTVTFKTTRPMNTLDPKDYVFTYDTPIHMIYAHSYPGISTLVQH